MKKWTPSIIVSTTSSILTVFTYVIMSEIYLLKDYETLYCLYLSGIQDHLKYPWRNF